MNPRLNIAGKSIPVWILLMGMIGAASLTIATTGGAVHQEDPPDIQHTSDVKIHLQDVDGKINTNVPITANRVFSGLPIEWDRDNEQNLQWRNAVSVGTKILTNQKIQFNVVTDVGEEAELLVPLVNNSEDAQIALVKCSAPSQVIMDVEIPDSIDNPGIDAVRLTGHNEWLINVKDGLSGVPGEYVGNIEIVLATTDAGMYPVVCELLRVG